MSENDESGENKVFVGGRINPDTLEKVEAIMERDGITKSEAVRRCMRSGVEVETGDAELVATDGGAIVEQAAAATVEEIKSEFEVFGKWALMSMLSMVLLILWFSFITVASPPAVVAQGSLALVAAVVMALLTWGVLQLKEML